MISKEELQQQILGLKQQAIEHNEARLLALGAIQFAEFLLSQHESLGTVTEEQLQEAATTGKAINLGPLV